MLTLVITLLGIVFDSSAQAPQPPLMHRYEIRSDFSYFSTDANYEPGGGTVNSLISNSNFTNMQLQLQFLHDTRSDLRLYGGLIGSWSESDDGIYIRNNYGLSEYFLGAQFWQRWRGVWLVPQADFILPAFRIDETGDDTLLGEGAVRVRGGGWAIGKFQAFTPFTFLGFEYRDEGRSFLLPYRLGITYKPGSSWWVQTELRGYESVVEDSDTLNRDYRRLYLRRVNGGSYHFYPINPALSELSAEAGLMIGPFALKAGVAITLNGSTAAQGWTGNLGLSFSHRPSGPLPDWQTEDELEMGNEEYDQSLFIEGGEPEKSRPTKKKIRKKIRKKPAVDQLLNETERELEGM